MRPKLQRLFLPFGAHPRPPFANNQESSFPGVKGTAGFGQAEVENILLAVDPALCVNTNGYAANRTRAYRPTRVTMAPLTHHARNPDVLPRHKPHD
jgi:hypothetical protein